MMDKKGSLGQDMQKNKPKTPISLTRVGITNLRRMVRIASPGHDTLFFAEMDLYAHLSASRAGVHMSRFLENIEKIAIEMATESTPSIESLAERMALAIAQTQDTRRSEVRIRAQFPERKVTPVSQVEVENLYTFIGIAASDGDRVRVQRRKRHFHYSLKLGFESEAAHVLCVMGCAQTCALSPAISAMGYRSKRFLYPLNSRESLPFDQAEKNLQLANKRCFTIATRTLCKSFCGCRLFHL